ncbi:MAG TPA: hypothetical protein DCO75_12395 [Fibrobacteres bacterium]|nr:hypothetical protein [Fibrobacterota bacterium]
MTCKALFIDFDGTIIDSESVLYESWRLVYRTFGIELDIDQWVKQIRPVKPHASAYNYLCSRIHLPQQQEILSMQKRIDEELILHCCLREGIKELFDICNMRLKIPVTIVTSSAMHRIRPILNRLRIASFVNYLVTSESVREKKPDPSCFIYALEQGRVQPADAFAIEDSPQGIAAAKNAGITTMAYPNPVTALMDLTKADITIGNGFEAVSYIESGHKPCYFKKNV